MNTQVVEPSYETVLTAIGIADAARVEEAMIRHELSAGNRRAALKAKLIEIYASQGQTVSEEILDQAVARAESDRLVVQPLKPGLTRTLGLAYIHRGKVIKPLAVAVAGTVLGGLFTLFSQDTGSDKTQAELDRMLRNSERAQQDTNNRVRQAELEREIQRRQGGSSAGTGATGVRQDNLVAAAKPIVEHLASIRMSAEARQVVDQEVRRLEAAATLGDGAAFRSSSRNLSILEDQIVTPLTLSIVDRVGTKSGQQRIWTGPDGSKAKMYYLIVEATGPDGKVVPRTLQNVETGRDKAVKFFGIEVSEELFYKVAQDKRQDGRIDDRVVGSKPSGEYAVNWSIPTNGNTITDWN